LFFVELVIRLPKWMGPFAQENEVAEIIIKLRDNLDDCFNPMS
jgi:hypothetical protein